MPNSTKEDKKKIQEKLKYIGLNLEKVPDFFLDYHPIEYRPTRGYDENKYRVYRYIDVRDIQIYLTPTNRTDLLIDKYEKAEPIYPYLVPEKEEDIIKHTMFLNMLHTVKIEEIEKIEEEQNILNKQLPFKIKYSENYLWQIYYSEVSKQYFMLEPMGDSEYASFFYLLKKQIECQKKKKGFEIFIPLSHAEYSGEYLKRSELADLENYLWLFTKDWPLVYEVYDKKDNLSVQIVGETIVYEQMKSSYKIVLKNKEEAIEFMKLIKALFILQTELPTHYKFTPKIDENGGLEFFYQDTKIGYDTLSSFVEKEFKQRKEQSAHIQTEIQQLEQEHAQLQELANQKELEYLNKEKEIATYLACRKSFFGKIKYFLKHKKKKNSFTRKEKVPNADTEQEIEQDIQQEVVEVKIDETKPYYTIEDLTKLSKMFEEKVGKKKNLVLDNKALQEKIEMMELKIKNATIYIQEIDEHNKSIFDFWKFTNKDNNLVLNAATQIEEEDLIKLDKTFDYVQDKEDLGIRMDKEERNLLSKEECDSIYLTTTNCLEVINILKQETNLMLSRSAKTKIKKNLIQLQEEASKEKDFFMKEEFDVFGGLVQDKTQIRMLSGKKHREIEKSKFHILDITKNTTQEQYIAILEKMIVHLKSAISKIRVPMNMSIYAVEEELPENLYMLYHIDPQKAVEESKKQKLDTLYKINIKVSMPAIYITNSMYYDNFNQTLPTGMEIDDLVLLDNEKYIFQKGNTSTFRVNNIQDEFTVQTRQITVVEYDVVEKEISNDK